MTVKNVLNRVLILYLAFMLLVGGVVVLFDPFFHYHAPLPGLKAVLSEKEYQCIGSLKNLEYDAVIAGSSVCENYDNRWFDEDFGCKSIKAIRSYGVIGDLDYYLKEAFTNNDVKYVFYNIDLSNLMDMPEVTFEQTGCPMYLYDENPFNDYEYLFNKDVILEKIPRMIAKSLSDDYDEGESYNWYADKVFSKEAMISNYYIRNNTQPMIVPQVYDKEINANIALIEKMVIDNKGTEFYIFFSPYSMLWWDNAYREGKTEVFLSGIKRIVKTLSRYENVHISFFMNEEDIICNLDNYMDAVHFSRDINRLVEEGIRSGEYEVDAKNIDEVIWDMRRLAYIIPEEYILEYEDEIEHID